MSSRVSQRMRRRRNRCRWANLRSTTGVGCRGRSRARCPGGRSPDSPEGPHEAAVPVVVVAAVAEHHVGAAPGRPRSPLTGGTASSTGMSWMTALWLPPVRVTASGMPVASVSGWCLLPVLPRWSMLRPVLDPLSTRGCAIHRPPPGRSPGRSGGGAWQEAPSIVRGTEEGTGPRVVGAARITCANEADSAGRWRGRRLSGG